MHTILVVDDNKNIREYCRRELEKCAYRVLVAQDGQEALHLCDTDTPDVVVLDVHMPGLDGLETIRRLLSRHGTLPVIFHTAHMTDLSFDYRSWPARACIEKSEDLGELKAAIVRLLTDVEQGTDTDVEQGKDGARRAKGASRKNGGN